MNHYQQVVLASRPTGAPVAENFRLESRPMPVPVEGEILVRARYLSLDPESALKKTNRKFKRRFQWMEDQLRSSGRSPDQALTDELEALWQKAKQLEQDAR